MYPATVTRIEIQTGPGVWLDVTGPTLTASITRADGDVGTLAATVADVELDPTETETLRFGRLVRVSAKQGSGWKVIYTGTIDTIDVDYHPLSRYNVRVALTANDNVAYLANTTERRGVATLDALRWLLDGRGVAFNINGATTPGGAATVVATNDNASLWSQILATRDSNLGYAWIDQENRLQVRDLAHMATPGGPFGSGTFGTGVFGGELTGGVLAATIGPSLYSNVEVDFNSGQIINSVTVNFQRHAPVSDTTTEIPYGPFEDADSIAEWGRYAATVTYQGLEEDEVAIAAFAQEILNRNAQGEVRAKSLTVPITSEALLPLAYIDLNKVVEVVLTDNTTVKVLRVIRVEHQISGDKWLLTLHFDLPGGLTPPSTPPGTGISIIPDGSVGTPQLQPGAVGTNEINFVARDIDGTTTTLAATSPTGAVEGDLWIDSDDGNKLWRWDGSDWVNVQDAAIAAAKSAADTALTESEAAIIAAGDALAAINAPLIQTTTTPNRGVKMTSTGLVGYDSVGNIMFTLNAATGALALKGAINSGSSITGADFHGGTFNGNFYGGTFEGAYIKGTVIEGGLYQTATNGERLTIDGTTGNKSRITFYTGAPGTTSQPGYLEADSTGTIGTTPGWQQYVTMVGPRRGTAEQPRLLLGENQAMGAIAGLLADAVYMTTPKMIVGAVTGRTELQVEGTLTTDPVPHAEGFHGAATSIANSAWTNYGSNSNQVLRGGMTYNVSTGVYTVPRSGIYQITASVIFANHSAGQRGMHILAGGVGRYAYQTPGIAGAVSPLLSFTTYLTAGQTIAPQVQQTSGAALAINNSSAGFNFVTITRIGD